MACRAVVVAVTVAAAVSLADCASLPTKERRAAEAAQLGLVSHPELADIRVQLDILNRRIETLSEVLATQREADIEARRADVEMIIADMRRFVDEVKDALKKP